MSVYAGCIMMPVGMGISVYVRGGEAPAAHNQRCAPVCRPATQGLMYVCVQGAEGCMLLVLLAGLWLLGPPASGVCQRV